MIQNHIQEVLLEKLSMLTSDFSELDNFGLYLESQQQLTQKMSKEEIMNKINSLELEKLYKHYRLIVNENELLVQQKISKPALKRRFFRRNISQDDQFSESERVLPEEQHSSMLDLDLESQDIKKSFQYQNFDNKAQNHEDYKANSQTKNGCILQQKGRCQNQEKFTENELQINKRQNLKRKSFDENYDESSEEISAGFICREEGCQAFATFNFEGKKEQIYCIDHKWDGMINILTPICHYKHCPLVPNFNYEGETCGKYCAKHKLVSMVNITKKCIFKGCHKIPTCNYPLQIQRLYCSKHKLNSMTNVAIKKCQSREQCFKIPIFNFPGKCKGKYCQLHKESGMVDVRHKRCQFEDCCRQSNDEYCNQHLKIMQYKTCDQNQGDEIKAESQTKKQINNQLKRKFKKCNHKSKNEYKRLNRIKKNKSYSTKLRSRNEKSQPNFSDDEIEKDFEDELDEQQCSKKQCVEKTQQPEKVVEEQNSQNDKNESTLEKFIRIQLMKDYKSSDQNLNNSQQTEIENQQSQKSNVPTPMIQEKNKETQKQFQQEQSTPLNGNHQIFSFIPLNIMPQNFQLLALPIGPIMIGQQNQNQQINQEKTIKFPYSNNQQCPQNLSQNDFFRENSQYQLQLNQLQSSQMFNFMPYNGIFQSVQQQQIQQNMLLEQQLQQFRMMQQNQMIQQQQSFLSQYQSSNQQKKNVNIPYQNKYNNNHLHHNIKQQWKNQ